MFIQFQRQDLTIFELKPILLAIEDGIVLVDDAMIIRTDDNDIRRVVILRTGKVIDVMSLNYAIAIFIANLLTTNLVSIVVEFL